MTSKDAKRRIGGHFGSALGASTKRRAAGWRDETDALGDAPEDESGSDAVLDPGTPLSSDSEVAEVVLAAEGEPALPSAPGSGAVEDALATPERPDPAPAAPTVPVPVPAAVVTLELLVAGVPSGTLRVLLSSLDAATEARLATPGAVEALVRGGLCRFGLPEVKPEAAAPEPERPEGPERLELAVEGEGPEVPEGEGVLLHATAGLLSAPREGPGLVLTLGPQPKLDATHRVLGLVLFGRAALRRLEVLAPLCGSSKPRQPLALKGVGLELGQPKPQVGNCHPLVSLEPVEPTSELKPFAWDEERQDNVSDQLDVDELDVTSRDAELAELKDMAFSRERQSGVDAVDAALQAVLTRLEDLGRVALDETQSGRRLWQQERVNHLLRVLRKLR